MKMTQEEKDKLKGIPKSRCSKCRSFRSYTNPLARCSICKKLFCYDHIRTRIEKKDVIDYCEEHYPL